MKIGPGVQGRINASLSEKEQDRGSIEHQLSEVRRLISGINRDTPWAKIQKRKLWSSGLFLSVVWPTLLSSQLRLRSVFLTEIMEGRVFKAADYMGLDAVVNHTFEEGSSIPLGQHYGLRVFSSALPQEGPAVYVRCASFEADKGTAAVLDTANWPTNVKGKWKLSEVERMLDDQDISKYLMTSRVATSNVRSMSFTGEVKWISRIPTSTVTQVLSEVRLFKRWTETVGFNNRNDVLDTYTIDQNKLMRDGWSLLYDRGVLWLRIGVESGDLQVVDGAATHG